MSDTVVSAAESALENQRLGGLQMRVIVICTLIQMCDGYDVGSIGWSVPSRTHVWHVDLCLSIRLPVCGDCGDRDRVPGIAGQADKKPPRSDAGGRLVKVCSSISTQAVWSQGVIDPDKPISLVRRTCACGPPDGE